VKDRFHIPYKSKQLETQLTWAKRARRDRESQAGSAKKPPRNAALVDRKRDNNIGSHHVEIHNVASHCVAIRNTACVFFCES
jgi:hypothetical protein